MSERQVVVLSGARTAIGDYGGSLKDVPPTDLAARVVREAVSRADIDPALIVGTPIRQIAEVVLWPAVIAVLIAARVEMAARAHCVRGAAIAFLVNMKTVFGARFQALPARLHRGRRGDHLVACRRRLQRGCRVAGRATAGQTSGVASRGGQNFQRAQGCPRRRNQAAPGPCACDQRRRHLNCAG